MDLAVFIIHGLILINYINNVGLILMATSYNF